MKLSVCLQVITLISIVHSQKEWDTFKATYKKVYNNKEEEHRRRHIFYENLKVIEEHNRKYEQGLATFSVKINHLADKTYPEIFYTSKRSEQSNIQVARSTSSTRHRILRRAAVPESIDWRDYGVITSVADQDTCNSCWAFAVVGTVEAHVGIYEGRNVSLSQQNLEECVDPKFRCSQEMERDIIDKSYRYITDVGIDTLESYPYLSDATLPCRYTDETRGTQIKGYVQIAEGDEEELKYVVGTIGPVTVAITTDFTWAIFRKGVYYKENCMNTTLPFNHSVVVVGYGLEDGQEYWLVKNSYGTWFGQQGYIKMARNRENNCGIASIARYPIMH